MTVQTSFSFESAVSYQLSNVQIAANKAKLALIPNPSQLFEQLFSSDSGFTYDSAKAEFTGGLVRQKDLRPTNSIVAATYTASKNLNWSQGGALTALDIGTPVLNAGKLECLGALNNAVRYENAEIGAVGAIGALKFKYTPNYSGTPATNLNLAEFAPPSGNADRMLVLHSASGGTLRLTAYTSAGTVKYSAVAFGAAWNPTAGVTYEFELNWDTIAGQVRLFVDGVLQGSMAVSSYGRSTTATRLYIGAGTVYSAADGSFDDVVLFSTVQHTSGYTPGYSLPETSYAASTVALPAFSYTGVGTILEVESSTVTEVGAPRYIIAGLYWNGSVWVASNGTYAQANTSADVVANLPSLNVTGAVNVPVSVVFTDSNTLSSVDTISVTVTGQKYSPTGYLEPIQAIQVQELISYLQTTETPVNTAVKVILKVDGVLKYHNGTAWVNSDGSEAQSNAAAELDAAFADLDLGVNSSVIIRWLLVTSSNTATPEIELATVSYDFGGIPSALLKCLVFGYLKDISDNPVSGATVRFDLVRANSTEYKEANKNVVFNPSVSVVSDVNGYFEVELVRSSEYEGTEPNYRMTVTKDSLSQDRIGAARSANLDFLVPDADQKDISDLLTAS
jgi:hypothetical protein